MTKQEQWELDGQVEDAVEQIEAVAALAQSILDELAVLSAAVAAMAG